MQWLSSWGEYSPVGKRIARAEKRAATRATKAGRAPEPVRIIGRDIAKTFWGRSWCQSLEGFSDISNRLPRGRTYVRNGSVVDLLITRGRIEAIVAGSMVYDVAIAIAPLPPVKWQAIKQDCAASIGSLLDLLSGRLSDGVMQRMVRPQEGLFPSPREMSIACSCPDGAAICKHLAAVFYAVGHRLDTQPELLFLLRGVDQRELIVAATKDSVSRAIRGDDAHALADDDLASIFGVDLGTAADEPAPPPSPRTPKPAARKRRSTPPTPEPIPDSKKAPKLKNPPKLKKAPKHKKLPKRKKPRD
ncbi:MAG: SWIM zinc finger family protein [Planctomycetia bacterium]